MNTMQPNLEDLFSPHSVAIIGASNRFGKWGFNLAATLLVSDFKGPVYLVNPRDKIVLGRRAFSSLQDIPEKVDLAVIAVPAQASIAMVEECGRLGIRNVLLVSSNFKEVGEAGAQLEVRLANTALAGGVRLVGPNTMGMVSTPAGLEILFMPLGVKPGPVDVISQSGNIGLQIMELSMKEGVGICRFVGSGNEAVLDLADYLAFFGNDPQSKVVVLYIESIRQGEKFLEAAAQVSRVKPILALKAGKTAAGAQAARSHSGAVAQSPQMISDLFKQAGIVETQSTEELIDLVKTFSLLKPPEGRRLGVVTLGGGWGVATTDAAALKALPLASLSPATMEKLNAILPPFWSHANPLDLAGTTDRFSHLEVLRILSAGGEADALIVLGMLTGVRKYLGQLFRWKWLFLEHGLRSLLHLPWKLFAKGAGRHGGKTGEKNKKGKKGGFRLSEFRIWADGPFMAEIRKIMGRYGKPILLVTYLPGTAVQMTRRFHQPIFGNPERAVVAMSGLMEYGGYLDEVKRGRLAIPERSPLRESLPEEVKNAKVPDEFQGKRILAHYGIAIPGNGIARDEAEAAALAGRIGFPAALKILSPEIQHKTDAGGVFLHLENEEEVKAAVRKIRRRFPALFQADGPSLLVEEMITEGVEVLLGMTRDPHFGPLLVIGLGGIFVEVLKDAAFAYPPISPFQAERMWRSLKGFSVLQGVRGRPPADFQALIQTTVDFSGLVEEMGRDFDSIEINPLLVLPEGRGVRAVDALFIPKAHSA
jgi:acyl-CoA synthetase (NDP forming)